MCITHSATELHPRRTPLRDVSRTLKQGCPFAQRPRLATLLHRSKLKSIVTRSYEIQSSSIRQRIEKRPKIPRATKVCLTCYDLHFDCLRGIHNYNGPSHDELKLLQQPNNFEGPVLGCINDKVRIVWCLFHTSTRSVCSCIPNFDFFMHLRSS